MLSAGAGEIEVEGIMAKRQTAVVDYKLWSELKYL